MKIVNFGSCNIDYVYRLDHIVNVSETEKSDLLELFPGGKGLNQSIAAARAGAEVYHAGIIGRDGTLLFDTLKSSKVNVQYLCVSDSPSGHAIIQVSAKGENSIFIYSGANGLFTEKYIDGVLENFSSGDLLILQNEINNIDYIAKKGFEKGMKIIFNPSPIDQNLEGFDFSKVTYLILNEIEGEYLSGQKESMAILTALSYRYPDLKIVLTLGAQGCIYKDGENLLQQPAYVVPVTDTTAAGDTFTGYFAAGIAEGLSDEKILERACAASILGNFYGASQIPEEYKEGLEPTTNFATTEYNFEEVVALNIELLEEVLEKAGIEKAEDSYTFNVKITFEQVPFEQIPDGVYVYVKLKTSGSRVIFEELTTYNKNEKVLGYEIDFGDGNKWNDVTPANYYYEKAGTYTIKVTVSGEKGSTFAAEREVTVSQSTQTNLKKPIIVSSVLNPMGGGSKNINVISDGRMPTNDQSRYDTYILGDPHGNPSTDIYIGYVYKDAKTVTEVVFTEGNHFGNGGWFADGSLKLQLFINGKWEDAVATVSPDYPESNSMGDFGAPFETYTFMLDEAVDCYGVRLFGIAGGSKTLISVGELTVK